MPTDAARNTPSGSDGRTESAQGLPEGYGYCNSCGEEMMEGDDCCEDGEWVPAEPSAECEDICLDECQGPCGVF